MNPKTYFIKLLTFTIIANLLLCSIGSACACTTDKDNNSVHDDFITRFCEKFTNNYGKYFGLNPSMDHTYNSTQGSWSRFCNENITIIQAYEHIPYRILSHYSCDEGPHHVFEMDTWDDLTNKEQEDYRNLIVICISICEAGKDIYTILDHEFGKKIEKAMNKISLHKGTRHSNIGYFTKYHFKKPKKYNPKKHKDPIFEAIMDETYVKTYHTFIDPLKEKGREKNDLYLKISQNILDHMCHEKSAESIKLSDLNKYKELGKGDKNDERSYNAFLDRIKYHHIPIVDDVNKLQEPPKFSDNMIKEINPTNIREELINTDSKEINNNIESSSDLKEPSLIVESERNT